MHRHIHRRSILHVTPYSQATPIETYQRVLQQTRRHQSWVDPLNMFRPHTWQIIARGEGVSFCTRKMALSYLPELCPTLGAYAYEWVTPLFIYLIIYLLVHLFIDLFYLFFICSDSQNIHTKCTCYGTTTKRCRKPSAELWTRGRYT